MSWGAKEHTHGRGESGMCVSDGDWTWKGMSVPERQGLWPGKENESESEVAQSCLTLCDPMDCSPPGSSVHGILQARILEWGAISFSRGSSQPRDQTRVSHIAGRRFILWATREGLWPGNGGGDKNMACPQDAVSWGQACKWQLEECLANAW